MLKFSFKIMVFLRWVELGDKTYFYLFHTIDINGKTETISKFIGEKKPSPTRLKLLKKQFSNAVKKKPQKFLNTKPNILATLQTIQEKQGYISQSDFIRLAKELNIPAVDLVGVATFYSQFKFKPPAKYNIRICDGTACHVQNSNSLIHLFEKELGLKPGENSQDNLFSLHIVRCLGVCASAPVMMVNDKLYSKLNKNKLKEIITELKQK